MFESGVGVSGGWLLGGLRSSNVLIGLWLELGAPGPGAVLGGTAVLEGADSGTGDEIGPGENMEALLPGLAGPTVDDEPYEATGPEIAEPAGGGDMDGGGPIRLGAGSTPLEEGIGVSVSDGGATLTQDGQPGADAAEGIAV